MPYSAYIGPLPLIASQEQFESTGTGLQFIPNDVTGFLPLNDPLDVLPAEFKCLEDLLQDMPIMTKKSTPGLLATGRLGGLIDNGDFPDLSEQVKQVVDCRLLHASAYLLEPCHLRHMKDPSSCSYGMGRNILPKSIALPFSMLAEKLNAKPFMEYALSYALYNYKRIDATKEISFDNLSLIRSFEGSKDEAGFVLVHVDMVSHSAKLIAATEDILCAQDDMSLVAGLSKMTTCFRAINDSMQKMWSRSSPEGYASFRTFIMGIKNQPMFPNGVVYEGVSSDPLFFRGESGANDSMVPLLDNLLEITNKMPDNPLTQILSEFRTYRPILHEKYLKLVKSRSEGLIERCMKSEESAALAITLMDFLREFRWRHWHFTKAYILSYSKHPVATGGSPIIKWLPNQLSVVLSEVSKLCDQYQSSFGPLNSQIMKIKEKSIIDIDTLNKEIKFLEETFK